LFGQQIGNINIYCYTTERHSHLCHGLAWLCRLATPPRAKLVAHSPGV
jgi:hypothetical protein